jgi:ferric-dicitrate binding protein FerR (iron transport regulator)
MRSVVFLGLGAVLALSCALPASSAGDKMLTNMHGDVSYVLHANAQATRLAPSATVTLSDDDLAKTGDRSMGGIVLPDSSRIILASNTTIQMEAFDVNQFDAAKAHFVVAGGKLRFLVQHPKGAKADYTFTTPTGEIAVRGTEGDISVDPLDGVRVNVYHLSSPSLPVRVTMINGETFEIPAGQKIWMRWQDGTLIGKVLPLTKAEIDRFSELGPPSEVDGGFPAH